MLSQVGRRIELLSSTGAQDTPEAATSSTVAGKGKLLRFAKRREDGSWCNFLLRPGDGVRRALRDLDSHRLFRPFLVNLCPEANLSRDSGRRAFLKLSRFQHLSPGQCLR